MKLAADTICRQARLLVEAPQDRAATRQRHPQPARERLDHRKVHLLLRAVPAKQQTGHPIPQCAVGAGGAAPVRVGAIHNRDTAEMTRHTLPPPLLRPEPTRDKVTAEGIQDRSAAADQVLPGPPAAVGVLLPAVGVVVPRLPVADAVVTLAAAGRKSLLNSH